MDIWKTYFVKNIADLDEGIPIPEVPPNICDLATKCAQLTEEIQNLEQVFRLFVFNLEQLHAYCIMYMNDEIVRKYGGEQISVIEINGLIINLISGGKTLIASCECLEKNHFGNTGYNQFRKNMAESVENGKGFCEFIHALRDMGQHGNLIIRRKDDRRFCFDLEQLLKPVVFDHHANTKKWMEDIRNQVEEKFQDLPHLAVTRTVISYVRIVIEAYRYFLSKNQEYYLQPCAELRKIVKEHSKYLYSNGGFTNTLPYRIEEGRLHLLLIEEDFEEFYARMIEQSDTVMKQYGDVQG